MTELRPTQHHAGEEGAERERDAEEFRRAVGDRDGGGDHAQREQLARPRARDLPKQPRKQPPPDQQHQQDERADAQQRDAERFEQSRPAGGRIRSAEPARERRQQHEHEHHREVFDDEPADRDAAIDRVEHASALERAQQHDRACDRQRQPEHEAGAETPAPQARNADAEYRRSRHLHDGARQRDLAYRKQIVEREMKANAEHQQHDADLGELSGDLEIRDIPRRGRTENDARNQVTDDRRQPQPYRDETQR